MIRKDRPVYTCRSYKMFVCIIERSVHTLQLTHLHMHSLVSGNNTQVVPSILRLRAETVILQLYRPIFVLSRRIPEETYRICR